MDTHAQLEIREYAQFIGENIVAGWVPTAWEAFNDYHFRRGAIIFTRLELAIISAIHACGTGLAEISSASQSPDVLAKSFGWLQYGTKKVHEIDGVKCRKLKRNRERSECEAKLKDIGLEIPWPTYIPITSESTDT